MTLSRRHLSLALSFALLLRPQLASADAVAKADTLFKEAKALMMAGRFAEACPKFAKSQRLDPAAGALFSLADCYEKVGKLVQASAIFEETVLIAQLAHRKDREEQAKARLDALSPRIPWLDLKLAPEIAALPDLRVTVDGGRFTPADFPLAVDPGNHQIEVSAPGRGSWARRRTVSEGEQISLTVTALLEEQESKSIITMMTASSPSGPNRLLFATGTALSLATLIMGIGFTVASNGSAGAADAFRARAFGGDTRRCTKQAGPECSWLISMNELSDTQRHVAIGGYVSAGILGAATFTYALASRKVGAPVAAPATGRGYYGIQIAGTF